MARLNHDPCIHHFSHPHPLHLSYFQSPHVVTRCSACQLTSSGWMYSCNSCNFTLHLSCTQLPSAITYPSHPLHTLALLPSPVYPSGAFICNACRLGGRGFSYHCSHCRFDIHITCAGVVPVAAAQLSQPQPQLQHNSFPGAINYQYQQYGNIMNPPAGQSFYVQSQSMGAMQGSYQQPAVANYPVVNVMAQGFAAGAAYQVGQNFVQSITGSGGGGDVANSNNNGGNSGGGFIVDLFSGVFGDFNSGN